MAAHLCLPTSSIVYIYTLSKSPLASLSSKMTTSFMHTGPSRATTIMFPATAGRPSRGGGGLREKDTHPILV